MAAPADTRRMIFLISTAQVPSIRASSVRHLWQCFYLRPLVHSLGLPVVLILGLRGVFPRPLPRKESTNQPTAAVGNLEHKIGLDSK